ncbi:MAG: glycosyltransferase family 39 protein [Planctomycetota bacterium]
MIREAASRFVIPVTLIVTVASVVLGWCSAGHIETLWDEHVDHEIAVGLQHHPLTGEEPTLDASQMRLPMYVNALAYAILGRDDLAASRAVSLAIGGLTILATAALGRMLFGPAVGLLAAVLLGFSPYFLSFARISMTEGDVFFACTTTLVMWAFVRYLRKPHASSWMLAAVLLAMALGAKTFAIGLFVVFPVLAWTTPPPQHVGRPSPHGQIKRLHSLLLAGVFLISATAVTAYVSKLAAVFGWAVLFGLWVVIALFVLRNRVLARGRLARVFGMVVFAAITFCTLMPVHLIEHDILREFARRMLRWDGQAPMVLLIDHLRLYAGILIIKLTVPLGVLTLAALIFGILSSRRDAAWRACAWPVVLYIAAICLLPLRQTFYLMGVYPLIMVMTAALIVSIARGLNRWHLRLQVGWLVVAALLGHLGAKVQQAYPYFHLHGYDLVHDRWLGAESRGYRNLIQTPSDGVESLIRWCNTDPRVRPGDRVVSFLWEDQPGQMVDDVLPSEPRYMFVRRGLSADSDAVPPAPSIEDADFVLLHINNLLGYGDRPPDHPPLDSLAARFEVVHTVCRGNLAVAWVYERR